MNTNSIISIFKSKGIRYVAFRTFYEFRRKSGLMRRCYPTTFALNNYKSLEDFRKEDRFFFASREALSMPKERTEILKEKAERILRGEIPYFNHTWYNLGLDYDWITNPSTGFKYDIHQHWSQVEDIDLKAGDIKFVWEKSRFSWLLTICRYDYHFDEDHSEFVFGQIMDWIDKNPLNCGPNYKCSQEMSIRILNWIFALNFYKESNALTEARFQNIVNSIFWQIKHVESNIHFSRICVRNNHAITETLTLYLTSLLMPWLPDSAKRKRNGKRWFEKEVDYQIEDDGTFIQDSMNYHRVVIQLLTYAIAIADKHGEMFRDLVYEKAYKSVNFLYQCQETSNGWLPNYGNNDGALFFPLSDNDYRDYRPQLDALHGLLTGKPLYDGHYEDNGWIPISEPQGRKLYPKIETQFGLVKFEKSGYYLIREKDTLSFVRCGLFKANGSTDQLHLDVWHKGQNVLTDGGSYMYNTDNKTVRYFAGTEAHNTLMLSDNDQMQKGMRFIWFYPPTLLKAEMYEEDGAYVFEGKVNAFKQIGDGITIQRVIKKKKGEPEWVINDTVEGVPVDIIKRQLWHTDFNQNENLNLKFESDGERVEKKGWASDYYGVKRPMSQIEFQTKENKIITTIKIDA